MTTAEMEELKRFIVRTVYAAVRGEPEPSAFVSEMPGFQFPDGTPVQPLKITVNPGASAPRGGFF